MNIQTLAISLGIVSTLSVALAYTATEFFPKMAAGWQHFIFLLAMLAPLAALPSLAGGWHIAVPIRASEAKATELPMIAGTEMQDLPFGMKKEMREVPSAGGWKAGVSGIGIIWAAGVAVGLAWVALAYLSVQRLLRRVQPFPESELDSKSCAVPVYLSDEVSVPFCYGILKPVVVFPACAIRWEKEKLRACFGHELAHIRRGDLVTLAVSQLACMVVWFNPLLWLAAGKLRGLAEIAADDLALGGMGAVSYAANLVAIVEDSRTGRIPMAALPMARRGKLRQRLENILSETVSRTMPGKGMATAMLPSFLVLISLLAALRVTAAEDHSPLAQESALKNPVQVPGFHLLENSENITKFQIEKNITLQATCIALPAPAAAAFMADYDPVKKPSESLAAMLKLSQEGKAMVVGSPSFSVKSGEPGQSFSSKMNFGGKAVMLLDEKSMSLNPLVFTQGRESFLTCSATANAGDTLFMGTLANLENPKDTNFVFVKVDLVERKIPMQSQIPTKAEIAAVLGQWTNTTPGANLKRIVISQVEGQLVAQGWSESNADLGTLALNVENQYSTTWRTDFGSIFVRFTRNGDRLIMESFTSYKDPSKKAERASYVFAKAN